MFPMFPTNNPESSWLESRHGHCIQLQTLAVLKTKIFAHNRRVVSRDPERLKKIQIFIFCTHGT